MTLRLIILSGFLVVAGLRAEEGLPKRLTFVGIDTAGDYYYQDEASRGTYARIELAAFSASPPIAYMGASDLKIFRKVTEDKKITYEPAGVIDLSNINEAMILVSEKERGKLKLDVLNADWEKFPAKHYRICNRTIRPIGVTVGKERFLIPVGGIQDGAAGGAQEAFFTSYTEMNGVVRVIVKNVFFFAPKQRSIALVVESDSDYFAFKADDSGKLVKGERYHLVLIQEEQPNGAER